MKNKKIIRVTTIPRSFLTLLKDQLNFINQDFDVIAVSSNEPELIKIKETQNVRVFPLNMTRIISPLRDIFSIYQMYKFLIVERPYIIHSHTPKAGLVSMIAGYFANIPNRVHTVAGMPLESRKGIKKKILFLVELLTYKFATNILPNSMDMYKFILKNNMTYKHKLEVIANGTSNGIDLEYFNINNIKPNIKSQLKNELKINQDDVVFLFIGRIVKDKGINELLEIFDSLSQKHNNIKLLLVGKFENKLNSISIRSKNIINLNKSIINCEFQDDIRPYLAISDSFIFPSYREGFPNVILQALSFNLPCISTDVNGVKEVIKDGLNSILIKKQDIHSLKKAILEMLDKEYREILTHNCQKIDLSKYDRLYVQNYLLKFYKSL